MAEPTVVIITQVYVPDPAAVGQHIADVAEALASRGHRVIVFTSRNGYDDPSIRYRARENLNGVEVIRLRLSSFGKRSLTVRIMAQIFFLVQATIRALCIRDISKVLVSTSPPFCGAAGLAIARIRGAGLIYWLMDLNPDQIVALGGLKANSMPVRALDMLNRRVFKTAESIILMDRFMKERVRRKGLDMEGKTHIIPPWPLVESTQPISHSANPFRSRYSIGEDKIVIMYSGNHALTNPLTTLLDAAVRLDGRNDRLLFMFVGGGAAKSKVDSLVNSGVSNIISAPYQPLEEIGSSLSAADVHVVSVGEDFVGVVHPCKVYGAMAVSRPILLLGPKPSHVSDLIDAYNIGWQIDHGDVEGMVALLEMISEIPRDDIEDIGNRAGNAIFTKLNREQLRDNFLQVAFCN